MSIPQVTLRIQRDPVLGPGLLDMLSEGYAASDLNALARDMLVLHVRHADHAVRALQLSEAEVSALLAAVAAGGPTTPDTARYLAADVRRSGAVELAARLEGLDEFTVSALAYAVRASLTTAPRHGDPMRAARALGLLPPVEDAGRSL